MNKLKELFLSLTKFELLLWLGSLLAIALSSILLSEVDPLSLIASLVGVTALIFLAKGYVFGQILLVSFCLMYGTISYTFSYYGEMITTLCMTMPIAIISIITWTKNPYGETNEVEVSNMTKRKWLFAIILTILVTTLFYFILKALNTSNLMVSTISITTSFMAILLTTFRSEYYAIAYSFNDLVLVTLWGLASLSNPEYLSVVICFLIFLLNDLYAFYNWGKIRKRQKAGELSPI